MEGNGRAGLGGVPQLLWSSRAPSSGLLGWVKGRLDGPLLLCIGGLHGNEPAGVKALEEVVGKLSARRDRMAGDFVAAAGNVPALAAGRRFLAYDLNRAWTPSRIGAGRLAGEVPEDLEMARLLKLIRQLSQRRRGPGFVLDIHTTSSAGGAFTTTTDFLANRRFAQAIPAPLVLGLGEHIEGTLIGYLDGFGYTTTVFECGQHQEEEARGRAAAAVWLAVCAAGLLEEAEVPEAGRGFRMLERACRKFPKVVEMRYRHAIREDDHYRSRPGLRNFQPVGAGDVLGDDRWGEVAAPEDGRLLMPLYQEQGEDGFFLVRESDGARPVADTLRESG